MTKILICVFVAILVAVAVSLPSQRAADDANDRPGYCKVEDIYIKEGETDAGPLGKCMNINCISATPKNIEMTGGGCAKYIPGPGCHMSAYDYTKRYPDCCPKRICDNSSADV